MRGSRETEAVAPIRGMTRARLRHVGCIDVCAMSRREHVGLRAFGVLLLVVAALWPRSRPMAHDHAVARHAVRGQYATAAARPSARDLPRPRTPRLVADDTDESLLID
jgi:hypothetical protein